jgi:2-polyprenyl-6-methoxyphenol hydroxylase-like FAD-dependent oxidoreductase
MTLPPTTDVLIVGAGPTGLTLATALIKLGAEVTVVDAATDARRDSRAVGVQPRTLEELARIGAADRLIERGLRGTGFAAATRNETLLRVSFTELDTPYPFLLLIAQRDTERVLTGVLNDAGGKVLREHRVLGLDPEFDAVTVLVSDPQGLAHAVRARYVVGCDGLHSGVRTRAGIDFRGDDRGQHYALGDIRVQGLDGPPVVRFTLSPDGLLLLSPLPDGRLRIVATVPEPAAHYGREAIQQLLDQRGPAATPLRVTEVANSGRYHVSTRLADTFRAGRIFLAGDAAHVHSPAGGQGMNTGIQDAINLSWKLAAGLAGASDELLDTYNAERRPNAAALLTFTEQLTAIAELRDPDGTNLRDQTLRAAAEVKGLAPFLANRLAQLDVHYHHAADQHPLVGRRIVPAGPWSRTLRWALLVPDSEDARAKALSEDMPAVVVSASPSPAAILIRPDGYVAHVCDDLGDPALRLLLKRSAPMHDATPART